MADCRDALVINSTTRDCIIMPELDAHYSVVSLAVLAVATSICADTWWTSKSTGSVHQVTVQPDGSNHLTTPCHSVMRPQQ